LVGRYRRPTTFVGPRGTSPPGSMKIRWVSSDTGHFWDRVILARVAVEGGCGQTGVQLVLRFTARSGAIGGIGPSARSSRPEAHSSTFCMPAPVGTRTMASSLTGQAERRRSLGGPGRSMQCHNSPQSVCRTTGLRPGAPSATGDGRGPRTEKRRRALSLRTPCMRLVHLRRNATNQSSVRWRRPAQPTHAEGSCTAI
jgi:hypothetical protein